LILSGQDGIPKCSPAASAETGANSDGAAGSTSDLGTHVVGPQETPESMSVEETLKDTQEPTGTPAAAVEEQKDENNTQAPTKTRAAAAAVEEQKDENNTQGPTKTPAALEEQTDKQANSPLEVAGKEKSAAQVEQERWNQKTPPTPPQSPSPTSPPEVVNSSQPPTLYPDNQLGLYGTFHCSDEEPETSAVAVPKAAAVPKISLPPPPDSLTRPVAVPPPQATPLSDSAIDKRVRRCMQPDSKGNYKVCQELREQWAQPGSPRNKVLKLFAQCGHDSDRVDICIWWFSVQSYVWVLGFSWSFFWYQCFMYARASAGRVLQALQCASHEGKGNGPECEFHISHKGANGGKPAQHVAVVWPIIIISAL